jgi:hypothetical protein
MVNEALLVLIWAVDASAVAGVLWLLASDPGGRRSHPRGDSQLPADSDPVGDRPAGADLLANQMAAQAVSSQART